MKNAPQKITQISKIGAAGAQGFEFSDLGTVSILHVTFSKISYSLWAYRGSTRTQLGPNRDPLRPNRIHQGFRAARVVSCEHVLGFSQKGLPDPLWKEGLAMGSKPKVARAASDSKSRANMLMFCNE